MKRVAACLVLALVVNAASANIIIFGDSLSDSASLSSQAGGKQDKGNNTWIKTQGKTGAPITSEDESTHLNPVWGNYLTNNTLSPSSQMKQLNVSPLTNNINYAWASAETGENYLNDLSSKPYPPYDTDMCLSVGAGKIDDNTSCVPSLLTQIQLYLTDVEDKPSSDTKYIIWSGGNDVFNNITKIAEKNKNNKKIIMLIKLLNAGYPFFDVGESQLSNPAKNTKLAVRQLLKSGVSANNIFVLMLPQLSITPAAHTMAKGNKMVLSILGSITTIYNTALKMELAYNYISPGFNIPASHIVSINSMIKPVLANPAQYGFSASTVSCFQGKAMPYCDGYLFFNSKHPTTKTHQLLAKYISKATGITPPNNEPEDLSLD
jgi:phospholipase/lecithinase/hemolysin